MAVVLDNVQLLDGMGQSRGPAWLVLDQGRIEALGDGPLPESYHPLQRLNLPGRTVMPGLIDAHVHLTADGSPDLMAQLLKDSPARAALKMARQAEATLEAGFVALRDLGGRDHVNIDVGRAIDEGEVPGPRVLSSGHVICMTGGHGWVMGLESDGPEAVRRAVRLEIKAGAKVIKFISTGGVLTKGVEPGQPQLSQEEINIGVEEAHQRAGGNRHVEDGREQDRENHRKDRGGREGHDDAPVPQHGQRDGDHQCRGDDEAQHSEQPRIGEPQDHEGEEPKALGTRRSDQMGDVTREDRRLATLRDHLDDHVERAGQDQHHQRQGVCAGHAGYAHGLHAEHAGKGADQQE